MADWYVALAANLALPAAIILLAVGVAYFFGSDAAIAVLLGIMCLGVVALIVAATARDVARRRDERNRNA